MRMLCEEFCIKMSGMPLLCEEFSWMEMSCCTCVHKVCCNMISCRLHQIHCSVGIVKRFASWRSYHACVRMYCGTMMLRCLCRIDEIDHKGIFLSDSQESITKRCSCWQRHVCPRVWSSGQNSFSSLLKCWYGTGSKLSMLAA